MKGGETETRHPKIQKLIQRAGSELIRRRFVTSAELLVGVYAALVQTLEDLELIRTGPFDAAVCPDASLADLDTEAMVRFIRRARLLRGFPLQEDASAFELLTITFLHNSYLFEPMPYIMTIQCWTEAKCLSDPEISIFRMIRSQFEVPLHNQNVNPRIRRGMARAN